MQVEKITIDHHPVNAIEARVMKRPWKQQQNEEKEKAYSIPFKKRKMSQANQVKVRAQAKGELFHNKFQGSIGVSDSRIENPSRLSIELAQNNQTSKNISECTHNRLPAGKRECPSCGKYIQLDPLKDAEISKITKQSPNRSVVCTKSEENKNSSSPPKSKTKSKEKIQKDLNISWDHNETKAKRGRPRKPNIFPLSSSPNISAKKSSKTSDLRSHVRYDVDAKRSKLQNNIIFYLLPHPSRNNVSPLRAPHITVPPNMNVAALQIYLARKLRWNNVGEEFRVTLNGKFTKEEIPEDLTLSQVYFQLSPGHRDLVLYYYVVTNPKQRTKDL
eukprot:TRINITY_DN8216_c0_g1_i1.p1 TRINITY_DN8216_c0_g1~~TRINITY_DN8216_c0_g1_i1.p1  ORF type:complete len:331 (+),score=60.15 TRINITY_DN8216_c0_g1_i1:63-1055(+)